MKKIFVCLFVAALAVGCASSGKKNETEKNLTDEYSKYQILDQEFDNLSVPNDGYDRVTPYEEQVNGSSYIQSSASRAKNQKAGRTMTVQKTVVDAKGNVLSSNATAPITDQETLPDDPQW